MTADEPTLHTLSVGTSGPRIAFLHGLFGQGRNWAQIAKGLDARATLVDLPDHGRSAWTEHFSFEEYAERVAATLVGIAPGEKWTVVGHSLGGKVAMVLALTHPDLVEKLCVVDIAPKHYGDLSRFEDYILGMQAMPLAEIENRGQADRWFAKVERDPGVRAFLLQNLSRHGDHWSWRANVDLFARDAAKGGESAIADFPESTGCFDGPVLWLTGADSHYVKAADAEEMRRLFPRTRQVSIKGASHWVHTDAPEVVIESLRRLLAT